MEEQEPQTQPTTPITPITPPQAEQPASQPNHAATIILQWLSYNFWAWLSYGLIWLLAIILINSMVGDDVSSTIPYAIAVSVVLGIVAIVTDLLYVKREPSGHKTGFAMVLMVIYTVGFSLVAIGSLVGALIAGLNLMLGSATGNEIAAHSLIVTLLVLLFSTVLNGVFIMRVTGLFKTKSVAKIFNFSMLGLTVLLLVLAAIGPVTKSVSSIDDQMIVNNLPSLSGSINSYISNNQKLPDNLSDLGNIGADSQYLVNNNLVTYKKDAAKVDETAGTTYYRYELCVNYKAKGYSSTTDYYGDSTSKDSDGYVVYYLGSIDNHPAGEVCYKIEA